MWFTKRKRRRNSDNAEAGKELTQDNGQLNKVEAIQLIKGRFNAVEAADILLSLINEKLKYHTVKSLNLDHCEMDQSKSKERIKQLREDKKAVTDLVIFANRKGMGIEIEGTVIIRLNNDNEQNQHH